MTDIEKLLHKGIVEKYILPLNSEGDFTLHYNIIKHRTPQNYHEKKEYLITLKLKYKNQVLIDNIIEFERFVATIQLFLDKRSIFTKKDVYFEGKTKNGENSLKVNIDVNRYISLIEAKQIHSLIHGALLGISKQLFYKKYMTDKKYYMSSDYSEKQGLSDMNLKDTEVIDWK